MARLACPEEAHAALHVVQRGHARRACFCCAKDRAAYLDALRECSVRQACAVHAYALMGNHVHLLFTSQRAAGPARPPANHGPDNVRKRELEREHREQANAAEREEALHRAERTEADEDGKGERGACPDHGDGAYDLGFPVPGGAGQ